MEHMIGELTGLAFVIFVFGGGIIRSVLHSWERRMELQAQRQQGQNDAVTQQLAALRAEVAGLRDTSTQFDMSLENSVQRLEERVSRIEARTAPRIVPPATEEPSQQVGIR
ncbi:MAG: hypothetical protein JO250_08735 [Armatimonadetes bacterium]|nr:hypothetical protein [Armatimonadota bacterium]